jgi:hypothetical protein
MIPLLLLMLTGAAQTDAEQRLSRMTALYDQVCLRAFPNDDAIAALMAERHATSLTSEEVKTTLGDDPGHGWRVEGGEADGLLIIEDPPYHACSLRWPMPADFDLHEYRAVADTFERGKAFAPVVPYDADIGDIHAHSVGEQRRLPDGGFESLFVIDQHITDPERRAAGETGTMLRFVHQYAAPGAE